MSNELLLAEIDRAIAADEQRRGELLFELGKITGRVEMARAIRTKLVAPQTEAAPPEAKNDAG